MKTISTVTKSHSTEPDDADQRAKALRARIAGLPDDPGRLHPASWERYKRDLERRAEAAEAEATANAGTVLVPVRVRGDVAERLSVLGRNVGLRRASWAAHALSVLSQCDPDNWYQAVAAFQSAMKTRAPSEVIG